MKYVLVTLGVIALAWGSLLLIRGDHTQYLPGALLIIAGAIMLTGGSILDKIDKIR